MWLCLTVVNAVTSMRLLPDRETLLSISRVANTQSASNHNHTAAASHTCTAGAMASMVNKLMTNRPICNKQMTVFVWMINASAWQTAVVLVCWATCKNKWLRDCGWGVNDLVFGQLPHLGSKKLSKMTPESHLAICFCAGPKAFRQPLTLHCAVLLLLPAS